MRKKLIFIGSWSDRHFEYELSLYLHEKDYFEIRKRKAYKDTDKHLLHLSKTLPSIQKAFEEAQEVMHEWGAPSRCYKKLESNANIKNNNLKHKDENVLTSNDWINEESFRREHEDYTKYQDYILVIDDGENVVSRPYDPDVHMDYLRKGRNAKKKRKDEGIWG